MHFFRVLPFWVCSFYILYKFQECACVGISELQVDDATYSTTKAKQTPSRSTDKIFANKPIEFELSKPLEESRSFRTGLFGGNSRNMTINLNNLAVLGLGMAAAVSLYSFFNDPGLGFKRSIDSGDELLNILIPIVNQLAFVNNESNLNLKEDYKAKPVEKVNLKRENIIQQLKDFMNIMKMKIEDNNKPLS